MTNHDGLEYLWDGTKLGVKRADEAVYAYSDLEGERGSIGLKGEPGNPGPPGAQGPGGTKGNRGTKGDSGAKGDPGNPGIPGAQGARGMRGERGTKGDTGDKGDAGNPGNPGAIGPKGATGDSSPEVVAARLGRADLQALNAEIVGNLEETRSQLTDLVTPEMFEGTDLQKIQQAYDYCVTNAVSSVHLFGTYNITGGSIKLSLVDGTPEVNFLGGELIKEDSGYFFTRDTASLSINSPRFHKTRFMGAFDSVAYVIDGRRMIRAVFSDCYFFSVSAIFSDTYTQSVRLDGCEAWYAPADFISAPQHLDIGITNCKFEESTHTLLSAVFPESTSYAILSGRITNNVIEGYLYEVPLVVSSAVGLVISDNYFEANVANIHFVHTATGHNSISGEINANCFFSTSGNHDVRIDAGKNTSGLSVVNNSSDMGSAVGKSMLGQGVYQTANNNVYAGGRTNPIGYVEPLDIAASLELKADLTYVDTNLVQKLTKGQVTRQELDASSDANKWDLNDLNEVSRQAILENNAMSINYVLGAAAVTTNNLTDGITTPEKMHGSAGLNQYPFDRKSVISSNKVEAVHVFNAIKDVKIFNGDATADYWLGSLRRGHLSGGIYYWQIAIQKNGTTILNWQVAGTYSIPSGLDKVQIAATSGSVAETATVLIDWNALPPNFVAGGIRPFALLDLKTYADFSLEPAVGEIHKIKVMAHNQGAFAQGGYPSGVATGDVDATIRVWRDFLAKHNCDILGLQEARQQIDTDRAIPSYPELYANSYKNFYDTSQGFNLALASKYPLSGNENITLSGDNRRALKTRIKVGGKEICIISTHLSSATEALDLERAAQRQEVLNLVANEDYFIICGDFNIRLASEYDDFKNAGYNLANHSWHGDLPTAHHPNPTAMKDNVITSDNIVIDRVVLDNPVHSSESDHLALICEMTVY